MESTESNDGPPGPTAEADLPSGSSQKRRSDNIDCVGELEEDSPDEDPLSMNPRKRHRRGRRRKRDNLEAVDILSAGGDYHPRNISIEDPQADRRSKIGSTGTVDLQRDSTFPISGKDEPAILESQGNTQILSEATQPIKGAKSDHNTVLSVERNTGEKSLPPSKLKNDINSRIPSHPEMRMGDQHVSTSLALSRLQGFTQRLAELHPHDNRPGFGFAQTAMHNAEVDYNYCLYYPVNKDWRPPPSCNKRVMSKATSLGKPKMWRLTLWHLVEKSMKNGKLEQIKDGSLVATKIPLDISDAVGPYSDEAKKKEGGDENIDDLRQIKMSQSLKPSLGLTSQTSERMMVNMSDGDMNEASDEEEGQHESAFQRGDEGSERTEYSPPIYMELSSGSEEGEIDDNAPKSDIGNALMDCSRSAGSKKQPEDLQQHDGPSDLLQYHRVLRDLNPEDLDKQLRYFHVGKLLEDVNLGLPVNCLACGKTGHESESCEALKCTSCGAFGKHMTVRCPTKSRCPKCRERGHNELSCPYKLKQPSFDEIVCDLCQLKGHIEEDCENMWRTSTRPWTPKNISTAYVLLFCYECGNQGHLGNDCPTRRPGKGFGSSTWTLMRNFDTPLRSEHKNLHLYSRSTCHPRRKNRMKIKGRAQDPPPPHCSEVAADQANFLLTKKPPESARKGNIQISKSIGHRFNEAPSSSAGQFVSLDRPFGDYGSAQQPQHPNFRNTHDPIYGGEFRRARYPKRDELYDGPRRRSRSPRSDRISNYRDDRYRPNPELPMRGYRDENVYRPAPSAAQNTYSKHRM